MRLGPQMDIQASPPGLIGGFFIKRCIYDFTATCKYWKHHFGGAFFIGANITIEDQPLDLDRPGDRTSGQCPAGGHV